MKFLFQKSIEQIKPRLFASKLFLLLFPIMLFSFSCSVPNLETQDCTDARDAVRELFSLHFGNEMRLSAQHLKLIENHLTPELVQQLVNQSETKKDYFTKTDDFPKTFRVGECSVPEAGKKAKMQVLLFWRDDIRSEQIEVFVETVKQNGVWLVNKVENTN